MIRSFFPRGKECLFTGPSERKLSRVSYRIAAKQLHALWTMVDRPLITNPYLTNMYFLLLAKLYNDQVIIEELTLLVLTLFLAVWLLSAGVVREREREWLVTSSATNDNDTGIGPCSSNTYWNKCRY